MHPIHPFKVSTTKLPKHQDGRRRRGSLSTGVSALVTNCGRCADSTCSLADEWAQNRCFYNLLGSTEVFLFSAHQHVIGEPLSIGRPLPNTKCYILDDAGEPVPVGQRGTLWVGGAGVAKGYINLPLTTAEKFQPDKFANDG